MHHKIRIYILFRTVENIWILTSPFFRPELFRFESLLQNDNRTNLDHAFNLANDEFAVPKLLDPAGERVFRQFTFLFSLLGH